MSERISALEVEIGPPPGPGASAKTRNRYLEDMNLARLAAIPDQVYFSLKQKGIWISGTLREDTPVSSLALKKRRQRAEARKAVAQRRTKRSRR